MAVCWVQNITIQNQYKSKELSIGSFWQFNFDRGALAFFYRSVVVVVVVVEGQEGILP